MQCIESSEPLRICWFCRKSFEHLLDSTVIEKKILVILGIEIHADLKKESRVCHKCIIHINQMMENRLRMRSAYFHTKDLKCLQQQSEIGTPTLTSETVPNKNFINHNVEPNGIKIMAVESQVDFISPKFQDIHRKSERRSLDNYESNIINKPEDDFNEEHSYTTASSLIRPLSPCYADRFKNDKCRPIEILSCFECPKKFKYHRKLKKHMRKHRQQRLMLSSFKKTEYRCNDCDVITGSRAKLRRHVQTHNKLLRCTICREAFELQEDLEWHHAICDGLYRAKLEDEDVIGRRRTRSQSGYFAKRLIDNDVHSVTNSSSSHVTSRADSIFTIRQNFVKRYVRERIRLTQITPDESDTFSGAGSVISGFSNITSISRRSTVPKSKSSELINFGCYICPENYRKMTDIMKHEIDAHDMNARYSCLECFFYFTRKEYLEIHERVHRQNLRCHLCFKKFPTKSEHRCHIRRHIHKSFDCRVCSLKFVSQHQLRKHRKEENHPTHLKKLTTSRSLIIKRKFYGKISTFSSLFPPITIPATLHSIDLLQPSITSDLMKPVQSPFKTRLYNGIYEKPQPREQEILIHGSTVEELISYLKKNPEYIKYPINIIHDDPTNEHKIDYNSLSILENDNLEPELFSIDSINCNSVDDDQDATDNIQISPSKIKDLNPMPTYTEIFSRTILSKGNIM